MRSKMRTAILTSMLGDLCVAKLIHMLGDGPIQLIDGPSPPNAVGEPFYHTTPSGKTRVRSPRAYKYKTLYHPSTRATEVGAEWIAHLIKKRVEYRETRHGNARIYALCGSRRFLHGIMIEDAVDSMGKCLLITAGNKALRQCAMPDREAVRKSLKSWRKPRTGRVNTADPYLQRR